MPVKYMTLEDLYNYFTSTKSSFEFDCQQSDNKEPLVVQLNGTMCFEKTDNSKDGMLPLRVQMNYVGDTLNQTRIKMKSQEAALPSSQYRPILAYIHEVDGVLQFGNHRRHKEDGKTVYDEKPIGVIIEEGHIEHDEELDMDFAVANGYVWELYSDAAEILEREQKCDVSVELSVRKLSYDAKDKILNLDDFFYSGCTVLGVDDEGNKVNPAMPGSNVTIADFSQSNNSQFSNEQIMNTLSEVKDLLAMLNIQNSKEGGKTQMDKFAELLEKYGKKAKDVTFEHENMSDEELEKAFENAFASHEDKVTFSVNDGDSVSEYSLSLNDKQRALRKLVNDTYAGDSDYYSVEVYDEDKKVVMESWVTEKHFRQSYEQTDENTFSLVGERVEVYAQYLTQEEIDALDKVKTDNEAIAEKLSKYEAEPEKIELLNSAAYSQIENEAEFVELKKQEKHFDMSVEEIRAEADKILLEFAKAGKLAPVQVENSATTGKTVFPSTNTKVSRYGNLFKKYKDK